MQRDKREGGGRIHSGLETNREQKVELGEVEQRSFEEQYTPLPIFFGY